MAAIRGLKNWSNMILNLVLYLCIAFLLGTGLLLWFRLPPGSRGGHGLTALGLNRHDWGDIHKYVAASFAAFTIIHLVLNWKWMLKIAGGEHRWRLWCGLATGFVLITFFLMIPIVDQE